ncbi:glutamine synthetase [Candidatus Poribacteria bacterium]|jgi:glutamine synthetase|nr:glutamine synthetase [Candidatus Poribacteria bacterium]MBT5536671.1 glutamine synthetase [Candidatus Poribacteria bacterium]MBT5711761.1 glutamine synthetase [Candidatus Poribacteria bacterium]MBT7101000.1 glutamine synthetase [Candidatus Poribacteria bacterium]MBT7805624.1 glutamine synthetase [Candidatus Poribacteria bacterium]
MKHIEGMLTLDELTELIDERAITQVLAVFPDFYGRVIGKRITGDYFVEHVAKHGMHACDYLLTVDMDMTPVPGYRLSSWETGYGDFHAVPDWATLRVASWLDSTAIVICDLADEATGDAIPVAPRSILRRQVERAEAAGFTPYTASELEFYLFNDTYEVAREKRYTDITRAGWYIEDYHIFQGTKEDDVVGAIRQHLQGSGIPVEFSKGEWGPGQQEINIRYADALQMADRHTLYKHIAKEVAWGQEKSISFMAKWDAEEAGSSCHVHMSLRDVDGGASAFVGEDAEALPGSHLECTPTFRHFVGGMLTHARDITLCLATTVNSYKRFQPDTFAPTAIAWSYDNRTSGFRVVGSGEGLRVECRVPGADVNPYLAYAALLAAGMDGVANATEPPPLFHGNAYVDTELPTIPASLSEAVDAADGSTFLRSAFGDDVVDHLVHFGRTEQSLYDAAVTDWERIRYFERI